MHCVVGVITLLLFDGGDCAALERKEDDTTVHNDRSKEAEVEESWSKVSLPPYVMDDPIFVLNIADCLSDLSDGFLPSTLHRVMPDTGSVPRNCLALFVGFDPNETIKLQDGNSMTYETWRKQRIARAQGFLKESKQAAAVVSKQ